MDVDVNEVDALVRANAAAVGKCARAVARRWRGHIEVDDLVSVGMLALLRAAGTFDPTREVPLAVHAARSMRWAMLDEARTNASARRGALDRRRAMAAASDAIERRVARRPRDRELADELGVPLATLRRWQREAASIEPAPLDPAEVSAADVDWLPEEHALEAELRAALRVAIAALPSRLAWVVDATYFDERPIAEVARELGISDSRVSQLRAEAVQLLRIGLAVLVDGEDDSTEREPREVSRYRAVLARPRLAGAAARVPAGRELRGHDR